MLSFLLASKGIKQVEHAVDGEKGVQCVRDHPKDHFPVVFMDNTMPVMVTLVQINNVQILKF